MRNIGIFTCIILLLSGCGVLPGMQNLDTSTIPVQKTHMNVAAMPVIKPITVASLLQHPPRPYVYRVGSQDVLNITIWNHPEFNTLTHSNSNASADEIAGASGYLVNAQGNIYLPLVGYAHVGGKTIAEIHHFITKRLSYYIRSPQVFLRVADYRSQKVYVMGEVLKPGFLPLNDQPLSITAAINLAGSLDPNASDPRHIYVIRGPFTRPEIYWLNVSSPTALLLGEQFKLQPDDVLIVSTAAVTRWNRFLNQLLPTLQTAWYTKAITR